MKNPPSGVKLVMAAVCVMRGIPPDRIPDPAGTGRRVSEFLESHSLGSWHHIIEIISSAELQ